MRLCFVFFAAQMICASSVWAQTPPPLTDRMFCDYVAEFAPQIARNRIRKVPFSRLDEYQYFDTARSAFLARTAQQIYARNPEVLRRSLDTLADSYVKECIDAFN